MKRALILLVTLLVATPLALGIMAGLAYYGTRAEHIPAPVITMINQNVSPSGYTWRSPVFGGLLYRDFSKTPPQRVQDIGELDGAYFSLSVPEGYDTTATLTRMGETVWSGRAADLAGYQFTDNGRYRIFVECKRPAQAERGFGSIFYQGAFNVTVDPRYETSDDWVTQGDVLAIRLYNLGNSLQPHAESDLGEVYFFSNDVGQTTAYIPMGYDREPGSYAIYVGAGRSNWEVPFRVTDGGFANRRVTLGEGETWPLNASDAPEGFADYQEQILPLLSQRDAAQYWSGIFTSPVLGDVASEYGTHVYVDDADTASIHPGMDITAPRGTEVTASAAGRVVFAAALESTGNTVVIEHGGGLKSLYFHLDSLNAQEGDTVAQGDRIGAVGSTGLCAEPHLHFEVRLGGVALNPTQLINGTSRLYHFG